MNKSRLLNNISLIKVVMMIMVVLYHSCAFFTNDWFSVVKPVYDCNIAKSFAKILSTFLTQTFTMASGYLFFYLLIEKNKYKDIKKNIINKFYRLIYPYIFTSIFWAIPISLFFYDYSFNDIVYKYVLIVSPSQLWFLVMLFFVFLFFFIFKDKIGISIKNLIIIYFICSMISLFISKMNIEYFQLPIVIQYILYFYFGGFIYKYKEKINIKKIPLLFVMLLLIVLFMVIINRYIKNVDYYQYMLMQLLSLIEILLIYILLTFISNFIKFENKIYKIFEKNSFGIYLFHQQIIYFLIIFLNGKVNPFFQVIISFFISLLLSLIISCLLSKNKYTKKAFGLQ